MKINKLLTKINYNARSNRKIEYIVIHYTGALGSAENCCKYFEKFYRGVSAHYFINHNGAIWQCVEDNNIAWHCGANTYKHKYARNNNSIGIEICVKKKSTKTMNATDKDWYFEDAAIDAAIELTKELMKKYNIPASNVIRHYDVSGKICPAPFIHNNSKHTWSGFINSLSTKPTTNTTPVKKSNTEIAKEVINGKWGNGADRKQRLTASGYDYNAVQAEVNKLLNKGTVNVVKKSNEEIAKEVIKGKWGNNPERKKKLIAAGYDYNAI